MLTVKSPMSRLLLAEVICRTVKRTAIQKLQVQYYLPAGTWQIGLEIIENCISAYALCMQRISGLVPSGAVKTSWKHCEALMGQTMPVCLPAG